MLRFAVKKQILNRLDREQPVANTVAVEQLQVGFDSQWEGLSKVLVFRNGSVIVELPWKEQVTVPSQVLIPGELAISAVGYGEDGKVRLTTRAMAQPVRIYPSGELTGEEAEAYTPTMKEQILSLVEEGQRAAEVLTEAMTVSEGASQAAQTAQTQAEDAQKRAETAADSVQQTAKSAAQLAAQQAAAQAAQESAQAVQAYGDWRYANALTAEVLGQGIVLDDAWTVAPKDMSLQGITEPSAEPSPAAPATLVSADSPLKLDRYGKNLWTDFLVDQTLDTGTTVTVNADGSVTLHKVAGKGVMQRTNVWLPAGTYTLSGKQPGGAYLQVTSAADSTEYLCTTPAGKGTGQLSGGTYYLMLYAHADTAEDVTIYPQLELGSQATAYEQFTETVYQIPLTDTAGNTYQLQGAPAAGDRIFKDTDGLWKLEKRMAEKTLRASGFDWTQYSAANPTVYSGAFPDAPMGFQTSVCTHFKNVDRTWSTTGDHQAGEYSESTVNTRKWFRTQFDTLAAWTAWLEAQNTAGTPVKLVYALATPTVYTLSAEAQAALNSITFSQAETAMWAENTAKPAISLTYVQDTNVVIAKLQNALAALGSV